MRRAGEPGHRGPPVVRLSRADGGGLILGIVLALLLIAAGLAALLYGAGLARDEAPDGFNLVGPAPGDPADGRPSRS